MKKILIFAIKPVCYRSYLYFADSFAKALREAGADVEIFHGQKEPPEAMERFAGRHFDAVLDFNSDLPRLMMEEGGYFLDQIDAPFYDMILDHPLYHHDTLKHRLSRFHALCLDENHKRYLMAHYPHIRSVNMLPVTGEDIFPDDSSFPEKNIDVLFSGTYTDWRDVEKAIKDCPSFLGALTKQLIGRMQADDALTQEDALMSLLPSLEEIEIIKETFPLHMQACFLCDSYLRARKREDLLLALAKAHVPLSLCGSGYGKSPLSGFPNVSLLGDLAFAETFALFRRSKITLNLLPEFKNGTHDRIYSAMLNHSLCMTDASPFLKKEFTDGTELCFYDPGCPGLLAERISSLLLEPGRLSEIAQNGYFKAKENHPWSRRAASFLTFLP